MKKNLKQVATKSDFDWGKEISQLKEDIEWLKRSSVIASKILLELKKDEQLNQSILAERMGVSDQYISKILKGKVNLTLKTISKLERALGINLIESIYKSEFRVMLEEDYVNLIKETKKH